jgi:hypothetical protein
MTNNLIYVYCLANSPPVLTGHNDLAILQSIKIGDFSVIYKRVSEDEFSEENFKANLSDLKWLETNAREHVGVINLIMENDSVIPFKFGTIFQSEENLRKFILDYSGSLHENFLYINDKEEWAIKIYCDRIALSHKIDELSEDAASLERQIMASSPGKAFLLRRKKTELIENELDRLCKLYGQDYYNRLKNLSVSTSLNNLLPKDFTGRDDTMILNAVFLVSKSNVPDFTNTVDQLKKGNKSSGMFIEATGPWPPFSFISLKEKQR